jgi:hypothetical protein
LPLTALEKVHKASLCVDATLRLLGPTLAPIAPDSPIEIEAKDREKCALEVVVAMFDAIMASATPYKTFIFLTPESAQGRLRIKRLVKLVATLPVITKQD